MSSANRPSGEQWGSKIGVILAVAGSAVGLGNFLRFPGKAASYGGGAFMIPYFCALLLLGIPICWIEWTMGRRGGRFGFNSAPGIFSVLWRSPISKYLGTIGLLVPTVIYMYYVYIESWCLLYAVYYAAGSFDSFGSDPYAYSQFFERVTGVKEDGAVFSNGIQPLFWFFLITFVVNFMVIYRGLSKGIETFCKFAMPMLIIAAVIVVVRVLTLPEQPTPAPWQRSLAAALPANEWDGIRERLADPSTTIDGARTIIHDAFETYYDMATEKSDRPTTPVMPPVGFMDTGSGLSIALAELRDPGAAAPFQSWLVEEKGALKDDQKRSLQQLEREQTRLENKGKGRVDFETRLSKIESERDAILLSTQVGPMPVMTSPLEKLGFTNPDEAKQAQLRAAAIELSELPRTVANGLGYMWNPNFDELSNSEVWLEAAGQIFFSLSVGFGVILNYSSYLRKKDDIVLSGLTASSTNEFCEVCLGGMVAIPATFIFLGTATTLDVINRQSTFGLGFNTLPTVFASMPAGRLFGAAWFGLLFLAGITSSLSMLQPAIAFLEEGFNLKRRASVTALGMMTLAGALPVVYFSSNLAVLDTMDYWVGTFMIYMLATIQVIIFGWVIGIDEGFKEAHIGAKMKIPSIFRVIIKYVTPAYLGIIFVAWLYQNAGERIAAMKENRAVSAAVVGMIAFWIFLIVLVHLASMEWRKQGRGLKEVE